MEGDIQRETIRKYMFSLYIFYFFDLKYIGKWVSYLFTGFSPFLKTRLATMESKTPVVLVSSSSTAVEAVAMFSFYSQRHSHSSCYSGSCTSYLGYVARAYSCSLHL